MQHLVPTIISEERTDLVQGMQYELYQKTANKEPGSPVIHTMHSYTENTVKPQKCLHTSHAKLRFAFFAGKYSGMTCHNTAFCQRKESSSKAPTTNFSSL
jgi:hypothetical protein